MRKVAIVLPTYNEKETIQQLIEAIFDASSDLAIWEVHILVVDSSSPDNTSQLVKDLQKKHKHLHLLETEKSGLGKAYIDGFAYALDKIKPFVIFEMDADLSHDPKKIPLFLEKIAKGADFVIGSRYIKGGSIPHDWGFHRKLFSVLGNWVIRLGYMNMKITDWTSGYRAIKAWVVQENLPKLDHHAGYVFQVALLDNAVKNGANVQEVPIIFLDRIHGASKINSFQYIVQTLLYVLFSSSFVRYVIVGLIGFGIDFGLSYLFIEQFDWKIWLGVFLSASVAVASNFILNNYWSFSHKKLGGTQLSFLLNFGKFVLISIGSVLVQTVLVSVLAGIFGKNYWAIYKAAVIAVVIIPYSYYMYNRFIWKD